MFGRQRLAADFTDPDEENSVMTNGVIDGREIWKLRFCDTSFHLASPFAFRDSAPMLDGLGIWIMRALICATIDTTLGQIRLSFCCVPWNVHSDEYAENVEVPNRASSLHLHDSTQGSRLNE